MADLKELLALNGLTEEDAERKSDAEKIKELEEQNQMLVECILEMADIIYA